mgnify:CR=1 FL=1
MIGSIFAISSRIVGDGTKNMRNKIQDEHLKFTTDLDDLEKSVELRKTDVEL